MSESKRFKVTSAWGDAARWALLAAGLNLAWEITQLPLYIIYATGTPWSIAYAVAHCTTGDVLIALAGYGAAALATHSLRWTRHRPLSGGVIATLVGVVYTVFSEWLNVSVRGSWEYAPAMPTIYGIGLSPLLQWLSVPPLMVLLERRVL
jgi:hypothetical protein